MASEEYGTALSSYLNITEMKHFKMDASIEEWKSEREKERERKRARNGWNDKNNNVDSTEPQIKVLSIGNFIHVNIARIAYT